MGIKTVLLECNKVKNIELLTFSSQWYLQSLLGSPRGVWGSLSLCRIPSKTGQTLKTSWFASFCLTKTGC